MANDLLLAWHAMHASKRVYHLPPFSEISISSQVSTFKSRISTNNSGQWQPSADELILKKVI